MTLEEISDEQKKVPIVIILIIIGILALADRFGSGSTLSTMNLMIIFLFIFILTPTFRPMYKLLDQNKLDKTNEKYRYSEAKSYGKSLDKVD